MNGAFSVSLLMTRGASNVFLVVWMIGNATEKTFFAASTVSSEGKENLLVGFANQRNETETGIDGSANEGRKSENRLGGFDD